MPLLRGLSSRLSEPGISDTAVAILNYFLRNPQVADDLEGIARWRLGQEMAHRKVEEANRALKWLVNEALLVEAKIPGGRSVFSLNATNINAARKLASTETRDTSEADGAEQP
jgi:hypothetical protein